MVAAQPELRDDLSLGVADKAAGAASAPRRIPCAQRIVELGLQVVDGMHGVVDDDTAIRRVLLVPLERVLLALLF